MLYQFLSLKFLLILGLSHHFVYNSYYRPSVFIVYYVVDLHFNFTVRSYFFTFHFSSLQNDSDTYLLYFCVWLSSNTSFIVLLIFFKKSIEFICKVCYDYKAFKVRRFLRRELMPFDDIKTNSPLHICFD